MNLFLISMLSSLEQILLSLFILAVMGSLIFLFYKLIVKEYRRHKKDMFSALDDAASYDDIVNLIDYRLSQESGVCFSLVAIAIDRLDKVAYHIHEVGVETYLSKVFQSLRMNLPRGGKMARTKEKDMFLIYIPELLDDEQLYDVAYKLKQAAQRRHIILKDIYVQRTATAAAIRSDDREINAEKEEIKQNLSLSKLLKGRAEQISAQTESLLSNLKAALFSGLRSGGNTVVLYNPQLKTSKENLENYLRLKHRLEKKETGTSFLPIFDTANQKCYGLMAMVYCPNNQEKLCYDELINSAHQSGDAFWLGQRLFESMIEAGKDVYDAIKDKEFYMIFPVTTAVLENPDASPLIDSLAKKAGLDASKITLYLRQLSPPDIEINIIKNLIRLKNNGYKFCKSSKEQLSDSILKEVEFDFCLMDFSSENDLGLLAKCTVIVENISSHQDMTTALEKGIPFMLGPYFGLPLAGEELLPFVTKNRL